ncbi:MAG: sugar phosphate nucleotidyltransferase, partial [Armatimonadota bacterium]
YKGSMIKEYFLNYECMNNNFTINLKSQRQIIHHDTHSDDWNVTLVDTGVDTNTGGRIKKIEKFIKNDTFMVTYGDGVANVNIKDLLKFHKDHGKIATLTGLHPISKFGVFQKNGPLVTKFKEKPKMDDLVSGGFFVFKKDFFNYLDDNSILEKEPMEVLVQNKELGVYTHEGFWHCMDTFKDAMTLNEMWENKSAYWKVWKS